MSRRLRASVLLSCGSLLVLGACNEVLGIEPAAIDPRLNALGNGAHAGTGPSSGGSDATAGTGGSVAGTGGAIASAGTAHQHGSGGAGNAPNAGGEAGEDEVPVGSGGTGKGGKGGKGGSGPDASGQGGEAGDDSGPVDPCDEYCDVMQTACTGEAAQYRDRDQCLRICQLLPLGKADGTDENGVACRLKYANKTHYGIGTEVTNYCRQAGPSADGKCGGVCSGFCELMEHVCTSETAPDYHFESIGECMSTCNGLPAATVPYSSSDPAVSDGDHALCRLFHVTSAAMADAEEHCEHAMGVTLCQAVVP
jgi:hypothetical protein